MKGGGMEQIAVIIPKRDGFGRTGKRELHYVTMTPEATRSLPVVGESYPHRMFSDVVAEVRVTYGDMVWFTRRNTERGILTPSYWTLDRFSRFFDWTAV